MWGHTVVWIPTSTTYIIYKPAAKYFTPCVWRNRLWSTKALAEMYLLIFKVRSTPLSFHYLLGCTCWNSPTELPLWKQLTNRFWPAKFYAKINRLQIKKLTLHALLILDQRLIWLPFWNVSLSTRDNSNITIPLPFATSGLSRYHLQTDHCLFQPDRRGVLFDW